MVTGRLIFAATALLVSVPVGAAAPAAKKAAPAPSSEDSAAAQLIRNCDAHKFETVVHEIVNGQPQQSKVKLCGKEGQTDADWLVTLKDAVSKVNSNKQMDAAVREQIIGALNAEIARIESPPPLLPGRVAAKKSVVDSLAPLPALPQSGAAESASLPPPRQFAQSRRDDEYAALPPLPTAPPPPPHVIAAGAGGAGAFAAPLPRPRLSLSCYTPGEAPDGPCTGFTRDTLLTVQAGEDLPASTSLRFVRDGDPKADIDIAQLKKGKSVRFAVPTDVCRHAVGGKLELRIVRAGQEVGTEGPYNLSC
jgi:hypothetical protein